MGAGTGTVAFGWKGGIGTSSRKLTVEGHTDERGGSEYNLALGARRAEAVRALLSTLEANDQWALGSSE